jgi:hypothetical protein
MTDKELVELADEFGMDQETVDEIKSLPLNVLVASVMQGIKLSEELKIIDDQMEKELSKLKDEFEGMKDVFSMMNTHPSKDVN